MSRFPLKPEDRAQAIQGLRELAGFLEQNPDVPALSHFCEFVYDHEFRQMLGTINGLPHEREVNPLWFTVKFTMPSGFTYSVNCDRPEQRPALPKLSSVWPEPITPVDD